MLALNHEAAEVVGGKGQNDSDKGDSLVGIYENYFGGTRLTEEDSPIFLF